MINQSVLLFFIQFCCYSLAISLPRYKTKYEQYIFNTENSCYWVGSVGFSVPSAPETPLLTFWELPASTKYKLTKHCNWIWNCKSTTKGWIHELQCRQKYLLEAFEHPKNGGSDSRTSSPVSSCITLEGLVSEINPKSHKKSPNPTQKRSNSPFNSQAFSSWAVMMSKYSTRIFCLSVWVWFFFYSFFQEQEIWVEYYYWKKKKKFTHCYYRRELGMSAITSILL